MNTASGRSAQRYVFCDTSPLTTRFDSLDLFGRTDPAGPRIGAGPAPSAGRAALPLRCALLDSARQGRDFF